MGNFFSKFKRKRKPDKDDDANSPKAKRVKLGSTSGSSTRIGYGMLFQQGRDSDIEVVLLGKTWKLHKSFLQQSPYFLKLLGDNSDVNKLRCSVSDWNVDCKSLELCFGYLYGGSLNFIQQSNVANVLATAKLLEMNEIVDRVAEFLIKHANIHNAIKYFYLAEKYALLEVCDHIYQRLLFNLIPLFRSLLDCEEKLSKMLSEIKMELLQKLVKDSDLIVVKDEYDVYLLMKKWLLSVTPCMVEKTSVENRIRFMTENGVSYLESAQGKPFIPLFALLDLSNLFLVSSYYDELKADNLLPQTWLDKGLDAFWKTHVTYYGRKHVNPTRSCTNIVTGQVLTLSVL
uniref:Protein germ cell-less n=1 Tax=Cacopsylla melanoneura TaxID=428564 RepID=A0A8D8M4F0_9HEMI